MAEWARRSTYSEFQGTGLTGTGRSREPFDGVAEYPGRVTRGKRSGRHVLGNYAPSRDHGPIADGDPGEHRDIGPDHHVLAKGNWRRQRLLHTLHDDFVEGCVHHVAVPREASVPTECDLVPAGHCRVVSDDRAVVHFEKGVVVDEHPDTAIELDCPLY